MNENRRKLIKTVKIAVILLCAAVLLCVGEAALRSAMLSFGIALRAWVRFLAHALGGMALAGVAVCVVYMLTLLFKAQFYKKASRIAAKILSSVLIIVVIAFSIVSAMLGGLYVLFSSPEEKSVTLDGADFVKVLQTSGWESVGVSYHESVSVFAYKSEAAFYGEASEWIN